jgi:O-antigen/teichoic acid export membrane protein
MHNERRILVNTTMLGAGEIAGQLANFILVVSFARSFGSGVLGHYSISMAVGAIAALFVSIGTHGLLIREISRNPASSRDFLGTLMPAQLVLAAVAWLAACGVSVLLIGDWHAAAVVMATCGYQILCCLAALLLIPFQATERMLVSVIGLGGHRLLAMTLGLAAIWLGAGAGTVTLALVIGGLALIAFAWIQGSRSFGRPALRFAPREALQLFRVASPFFGLAALGVLYARGGMIILSALATPYAVGLYAVADRFMVAGGLAPTMFNTAVYPALSRVAHTSLADAKALAVRCLRLMLVGTIPLSTMLTIFSIDVVRLVFGPQYQDSSRVLQVLAWTLPIRGAQWLLGSQLVAMDQQSALARARLAGLCTFLALTPLMILGLGYVGVAWAVLSCDGLQLALYWTLLRRTDAAPSCTIALLAPALASAVTLLASAALSDLTLPLRLLSVSLVMAVGLWVSGAIRLHDLGFLRNVMSGKGSPQPETKPG